MNSILVTGGCGFIGTNFVRFLFEKDGENFIVVNVDKLTYAANPENLVDIQERYSKRYFFERADICDFESISRIIDKYDVDTIVHFAAESHVDRSILGPSDFVKTNIVGTFTLLEAVRERFEKGKIIRFHHISTDEVYGSLGKEGYFYESSPYQPRSPYSASKAASDHLVRSYHNTYGLNVTISICSNNYGPYQFPEKLIPLMIVNMLENKELPVYGDGKHIRDWLFVYDHCTAIWEILKKGKVGETYNIGGENEWENIRLVEFLCELVAKKINKEAGSLKKLIKFVKDRPGHDRRYAINCEKIKNELGWRQSVDFETGLDFTVDWYIRNIEWLNKVRSGEYLKWIEINYGYR
ncbi:MAG: dTDP-glucose 4,6-dehydratase [Ignavibacteria bacterium]|nr:dTDP-glucose 4,6-dehydratase [Ignavibacteria bacterium]